MWRCRSHRQSDCDGAQRGIDLGRTGVGREPAGEISATGVRRSGDGVDAIWALSWPEQQAAGLDPIVIRAYYSTAAHHPHLQAGTAGNWPLNVFDERQAAAELPVLRVMASADLHNLVFQRDYRIIPAIVNGWMP